MPAEHSSPSYEILGNTIIRQLSEFKELRAILLLKQIKKLDEALPSGLEEPRMSKTAVSNKHLAETVRQALRALEK